MRNFGVEEELLLVGEDSMAVDHADFDLNESARSPMSIIKFLACWATQPAVGFAVTPRMCTRRVGVGFGFGTLLLRQGPAHLGGDGGWSAARPHAGDGRGLRSQSESACCGSSRNRKTLASIGAEK